MLPHRVACVRLEKVGSARSAKRIGRLLSIGGAQLDDQRITGCTGVDGRFSELLNEDTVDTVDTVDTWVQYANCLYNESWYRQVESLEAFIVKFVGDLRFRFSGVFAVAPREQVRFVQFEVE
jgi:hypothetical protein